MDAILYLEKLNSFYIGATQEDVQKRILNHNDHVYGKQHYTAKTNDWRLFIFIESIDYARAIRIERHIKKMKSKIFITNIKKYPEMMDKLKNYKTDSPDSYRDCGCLPR